MINDMYPFYAVETETSKAKRLYQKEYKTHYTGNQQNLSGKMQQEQSEQKRIQQTKNHSSHKI